MANEVTADKRLNTLLGGAARYFGFNILNAAIPFVFLPVMTRYLVPEDYGIAGIFLVLVGIGMPLIGLNVHAVVNLRYLERDRLDFPAFMSSAFVLVGLSAVLAGMVVAVFTGPIAWISAFPAGWLWAVVVVCAAQAVANIAATMFQIQLKPTAYGLFQTFSAVLLVALSLAFVVTMGWGWQGRIGAQVLAVVLAAAVGTGLMAREGWLTARPRRSYVADAVRFGLPLVPHYLGGYIYTMLDRMFVAQMISLRQAGLYVAGYQVCQVVTLVETSFNQAWSPWHYRELAKRDPAANRRIVVATYAYFLLLLAFAGAFGLVVPWVMPWLLGPRYAEAGLVVPWLALAFALGGMYKMVGNYLFYAERTGTLGVITLTIAAASPAFTYGLIKLHGVVGAAEATAAAFLLQFLLTWVAASRVHPMPWLLAREVSLPHDT
ncbi:MAG: polysaccharide biosynthesis protein [Cyanobacteria bacterium RYN_339]|nr:polysaccharide biosynthesis protein [Cyanobacteria bacterium RYN_339]